MILMKCKLCESLYHERTNQGGYVDNIWHCPDCIVREFINDRPVFELKDLFPTGEEYVKLDEEKRKNFLDFLLTSDDLLMDVLALEAYFRGGTFITPSGGFRGNEFKRKKLKKSS
jgi:hypothetical protein